jgi:acetylornithine deacetylase/succinyl-diaminopimelate desuccinylase-like protein
MEPSKVQRFVDELWQDSIMPALTEYIRIPAKSPFFDQEWDRHGYMEDAIQLAVRWCEAHRITGMNLEVLRLPGRTPLLYLEIAGTRPGTVLLYGHLDKQPEFAGWRSDLGPWKPVIENERLYGRGGADDGYAMFASLGALMALHDQRISHPRCVLLLECSEESGSPDLPAYIEALSDRLGTPELVVCMDSGCGNYDQLWATTSLRGLVAGTLTVEVLEQGVHSGDASGIVPSTFRIARQLLARIEDAETGEIIPPELHAAAIPEDRVRQAQHAAHVLGAHVHDKFPFAGGCGPIARQPEELILNRTWKPALEVIGAAGLPSLESAGNVLRPKTEFKLSFRLPPTVNADAAAQRLKEILEADPPYGAKVTFAREQASSGWSAAPVAADLAESIERASKNYFGRSAVFMGEGVSIPFMGMLGEKFPKSQFLITGVLGPQSNAHGPNEFLHLPTVRRLTSAVADVLAGTPE